MTKQILYIKPTSYADMNETILKYLQKYADPDSKISICSMPRGPKHLEYMYYQSLAQLEILNAIKKADNQGNYDAAIIGCFDDPGLAAGREICENMSLSAPCEAACHIAATLADKFSIIIGRDKWRAVMRDNVYRYGFESKLASFRSLDMGVLDFQNNPRQTEKRIREEIELAISKDKAEAIILGCTMKFGFFEQLQKEFPVPIIDSMIAALKYAEMLAGLKQKTGWYTSKVGSYASPPQQEISDWQLEKDYY